MPRKNRIPLVGTPDQEFSSEASISAKHYFERVVIDGESKEYALAGIREDAETLASAYGLSASDFIAMAESRFNALIAAIEK